MLYIYVLGVKNMQDFIHYTIYTRIVLNMFTFAYISFEIFVKYGIFCIKCTYFCWSHKFPFTCICTQMCLIAQVYTCL